MKKIKGDEYMSYDTSGMEKGIGIAFTAVGASVAFVALDDLRRSVNKKGKCKKKDYMPIFKPIKGFKW